MTFTLTCVAWIFFRAPTIKDALLYVKGIFTFDFTIQYLDFERYTPELLLLILTFILVEWFSREYEHPVFGRFKTAKILLILAAIVTLGSFSTVSDFIYFQF
jgi:hypothetical protein